MKKVIALAMNIKELQDQFTNPQVIKKYPGAGFLPHLAKLAKARGWDIMGASKIDKKTLPQNGLPISNVYVLQEDFNPDGIELIKVGAVAQVVTCLESKLYAPQFYDSLPQFKKIFKYQVLFEGGTHELKFPSYDMSDVKVKRLKWNERKKRVCMISSNKQWWASHHDWASPSYCEAVRNELHTRRLKDIEKHPDLDLYGPGWDNLSNLPPWWEHLKPIIQKAWRGPCKDKLETLSQYQWNICHENTDLDGYITEKLPQCRVAGCASVYVGGGNKTPIIDLEKGDYSNEAFATQIMELMES